MWYSAERRVYQFIKSGRDLKSMVVGNDLGYKSRDRLIHVSREGRIENDPASDSCRCQRIYEPLNQRPPCFCSPFEEVRRQILEGRGFICLIWPA